jgi:hypothetical protein
MKNTMINYAELFSEFSSEVRQGLPYCQILNAPNLPQAQLEKLNPSHGIFISKENVELSGLNTEGMQPHEQAFRDGEEIIEGFITPHLRFIVLHITPLVVQSGRQIMGFYFADNGGVSDFGKLVAQDSQTYNTRSWWLIAPLNQANQLISSTPIKLSLRGAVGAAFSQERKKTLQELELEFFKKAGKPKQTLSSRAHSFLVMDWNLSPYKTAMKAPHEYVSSRLGITDELKVKEEFRYGKGKDTRTIKIMPEVLDNLLIVPSSPTGQTISSWYEDYEEAFFRAIKSIDAPSPKEEAPINLESDMAALQEAQRDLLEEIEPPF